MSRNCDYSGVRRGPRIPPLSPNLKRIYRILSKTIMSWGFDVHVADSMRTRSRYLQIPIEEGRSVKIRISDHPPGRLRDIDFDVYTNQPRRQALNCDEVLAVLKKRLCKPRTDKRISKLYESEDSNG